MVVTHLPWPGPRPYTEGMAGVFMGRESELSRIVDIMHAQRLALMTATSGAGKTSLIQAGLLPNMRKRRLGELDQDVSEYPETPFPILLNQWLGRAGKGESIDYAQLVALEMHRYLTGALRWYRQDQADPAETAARRASIDAETSGIESALAKIAEYAVDNSFATLDKSDGNALLEWQDPGRSLNSRDQTQITDRLLAVLDIAADSLGEVLLILDQFEEILLDRQMHKQALAAVETVYLLRDGDIRQFISMREDNSNLVGDLDRRGILESKRKMLILPLSVETTKRVIEQVSSDADYHWASDLIQNGTSLLDALVGAFSGEMDHGASADEVNLVGLQVVLNGMFRDHVGADGVVDRRALEEYCARLASDTGKERALGWWLNEGLRIEAPRCWIIECLSGRVGEESAKGDDPNIFEAQVMPMAARMAELLVTPGGNKRPMTVGELRNRAFERVVKDDFAGEARHQKWSAAHFEAVQKATCDEALARLTRGNILKKQGAGQLSDDAYELVHDQFGKPLQAWAKSFVRAPEYDLSSLEAIDYRSFKWSGQLAPHDDDGVIPSAIWRGCRLRKVDLSDLVFRECDFSRTRFDECTFRNVTFEDSVLENALFKYCVFENVVFTNTNLEDSEFSGKQTEIEMRNVTFDRCNLETVVFGSYFNILDSCFVQSSLRSTTFRAGVVLDRVSVSGGAGISFSELIAVTLRDCTFEMPEGENGRLLEMRNTQLRDCTFEGEVVFNRCALDGTGILGEKGETSLDGILRFTSCSMVGLHLKRLDVRSQTLHFVDCDCRGATFERLDARQDEATETDVRFERVSLVGALAKGCLLEDIDFVGDSSQSTDISALTIVGSKNAPSSVARLTFTDLDAENISIERCSILGDVTFTRCKLSGSNFEGDDTTRQVSGHLRFEDRCDLAAAEFDSLDFSSEFPLEIDECWARGLLFFDVELAGSQDRPAGRFTRTELTGALALGCRFNGAVFSGNPPAGCEEEGAAAARAPAMTFVMRPLERRQKRRHDGSIRSALTRPTVIGSILFERLDMSSFGLFEGEIKGSMTFRDCDLGSGTIGLPHGTIAPRLTVLGNIVFDGCEMPALELNSLEFRGSSLRIDNGCDCESAMFYDIGFSELSDEDDGLFVNDSDLTGVVFLDCTLPRAVISGVSGELTSALTLSFRETRGERAELGEVTFENYRLDGGTFEGVMLTGPVVLRNCSLLRTKYFDIDSEGGGSIDVRESDLLFAQIDDNLLAPSSCLLLTDAQLHAALEHKEHEAELRLQNL